jgi:hypothetical protein
VRLILAGLAVGMGITEGADIGALFSVLVAGYMLYQARTGTRLVVNRYAGAAGRVVIVAFFAALLAAQSLTALITTQISGVAGTEQTASNGEKRWDWATQFSLPKREALTLLVPGLFGYRMGTPDGGCYWGAAGRDAAWEKYFANGKEGQRPSGFLRFTGGGIYTGVMVVMVGLWAAGRSLRRGEVLYSREQRQWLWFWLGVGLISLLLAFGRYAPFYRLVYALPYVSTMRNPGKFLHVLSFALVVLFGYGVDGLWRGYLKPLAERSRGGKPGPTSWWQSATRYDRRWLIGCGACLGIGLLGWMIYSGQRLSLVQYLETVEFKTEQAEAIASFSLREVGWFMFFLALATGLMAWLLSGGLRAKSGVWGGLLMTLFLVVDLGRANQPWIIYHDFDQQYGTNPIIEQLRQQPYEHRVACLPRTFENAGFYNTLHLPQQLRAKEELLDNLYRGLWAQHLFFYYNIQSLDVVQLARVPEDLSTFEKAFSPTNGGQFTKLTARHWQLTNTRYVLGAADLLDVVNETLDPQEHRLRLVERFETALKPGIVAAKTLADITVAPSETGRFALFEFGGALPRAALYGNWEVSTNQETTLARLADANFHPEQVVLVDGKLPMLASNNGGTNLAASAEFERYAPKDIVLRATAVAPSVLLLNDRFDPNWKVLVDGAPSAILRCNYLMRGVYLNPGAHRVEFLFQPPFWQFYISLGAIALGLALAGIMTITRVRPALAQAPTAPAPPATKPPRNPAPTPVLRGAKARG